MKENVSGCFFLNTVYIVKRSFGIIVNFLITRSLVDLQSTLFM